MATRGDRTREHLLDVAERLFGDRGLAGVSLREIRIEAGARNTAAVQFHFGNRDGLLVALTERHLPRIAAIQDRLYERMIEEGRGDDPRSLTEVLVRPSADYLLLGSSERAWIKIMGDLASAPDLLIHELVSAAPETAVRVGSVLFELLSDRMPTDIATERVFSLAQSTTHMCANRARLIDDPEARPAISDALFAENLVDMAHGALFAPLSAATSEELTAG
jgi:AcrR family transcriptional regulator